MSNVIPSLFAAEPVTEDRRRYKRFRSRDIEVTLVRDNIFLRHFSVRTLASVVDFSEGGLCICASTSIGVDKAVRVVARVARLHDELSIPGYVQRLRPHPTMQGTYVMGIRFADLPAPMTRVIAGWRRYLTATLVLQRDAVRKSAKSA